MTNPANPVNPAHMHSTVAGEHFNDECTPEDAAEILVEVLGEDGSWGQEVTAEQLETILANMSASETALGNAQSPAACFEILYDWNDAAFVNGKRYVRTWMTERYLKE